MFNLIYNIIKSQKSQKLLKFYIIYFILSFNLILFF